MNTKNCFFYTLTPTKEVRKPRSFATLPLPLRHLRARPRRKITVKERDSETGLYYYGARYLDPKASRWLSGDPAVGEYVPSAPVSDEARKRNGSLPGMGGVFNYVNLHVYHYAGNNPVKYVDPDGREIEAADPIKQEQILNEINASSYDQYKFNEAGKLEKMDDVNSNGSLAYSRFIDVGIASDIKIRIHWYNEGDQRPTDVNETHTRQPPRNAMIINTYIVGGNERYPVQDGSTREFNMARKLMHELVGHIVPWIMRITTPQNAIVIENYIINDLYYQLYGKDAPLRSMRVVEDDPTYEPYF